MANEEHLARLIEGVDAWNAWWSTHPEIYTDLGQADLRGINLSGAKLDVTALHAINLSGTELKHTFYVTPQISRAMKKAADG